MMQSQSLLFDNRVEAPVTEGIKYTGSKLKLLPQILELARKTGAKKVFDGFSGSTRVSQAFAQVGYRVTANDIAPWSEVLATCYLRNEKPAKEYRALIAHLNSLPPEDGWFTENYGGDVTAHPQGNAVQPDGVKKPWQKKNTRKLDAIRGEIERLELDETSKNVALTSLILALDQVDSTLGHYVSYLRNWAPRSFNDLQLKTPRLWQNEIEHTVLSGDVFAALADLDADLAYYDPPYGSNNEKMPPSRVRYASYYHVWATICRNDCPRLFGRAKRRIDSSDRVAASAFEEFRRNQSGKLIAIEAVRQLLARTPCRWIILSYSSGGQNIPHELCEALNSCGEVVDTIALDYQKNVMSTMKWSGQWLRDAAQTNREFLFLIRKEALHKSGGLVQSSRK